MRRHFSRRGGADDFKGYDREATATRYAGVTFRSKLEATWAAFFDLAGIEWEYEPISLPGWIPDFRLFGAFLCEVKPIHMTGFAVASTEYRWIRKALRNDRALIFGAKPTGCIACMVTSDNMTVEGRTVFYDPDDKFKMVSVSGDGGDHPLRNSACDLWKSAEHRIHRESRRFIRRSMEW